MNGTRYRLEATGLLRAARPALLLLAALVVLAGVAWAQVPARQGHEVSWHVLGAGGQDSATDAHQVRGTLGQFAIGRVSAAGGHGAGSGYWYGAAAPVPPGLRVYLPLVFKIER